MYKGSMEWDGHESSVDDSEDSLGNYLLEEL